MRTCSIGQLENIVDIQHMVTYFRMKSTYFVNRTEYEEKFRIIPTRTVLSYFR